MNFSPSNGLLPSPIFLFLIGFVYYLISPVIVMFFLLDEAYEQSYELLLIATNYLDVFFFDKSYWLDLFLILLSFYAGYRVTKNLVKQSQPILLDKVATSNVVVVLILCINTTLLCLLIVYASYTDVMFFSGYKEFNIVFLGSMSTLAFLNIYLFIFFSTQKLSFLFFLMFIIGAVILLGLGSRNVALNGVIAFIIYLVWRKPSIIRDWRFYLVLIALPLALVAIGIWRTGYEFSLNMVISHFFADALFVLSSASCYFQNVVERPLFEYPTGLIAGIINFLPSLFFPEKIDIIARITLNPDKYSPFGASSILVNLYSNFGLFYPFFVFTLASLFTFLYIKAKSSFFYRASYLTLSPLLLFQVFNQPLYSLVKLLLYNGLLLPFIIISFLYIIQMWIEKTKNNAL